MQSRLMFPDKLLAPARNPYYSKGSQIYGQGFVFDDQDSKANPVSVVDGIRKSEEEFAHVFALFGGIDLNQQPELKAEKWVINVSDVADEDALKKLPLLYKLISEKVNQGNVKNFRTTRTTSPLNGAGGLTRHQDRNCIAA